MGISQSKSKKSAPVAENSVKNINISTTYVADGMPKKQSLAVTPYHIPNNIFSNNYGSYPKSNVEVTTCCADGTWISESVSKPNSKAIIISKPRTIITPNSKAIIISKPRTIITPNSKAIIISKPRTIITPSVIKQKNIIRSVSVQSIETKPSKTILKPIIIRAPKSVKQPIWKLVSTYKMDVNYVIVK